MSETPSAQVNEKNPSDSGNEGDASAIIERDFPPSPATCLRLIDELWVYLREVEEARPGPVMRHRIESTYRLLNEIGYTAATPNHLRTTPPLSVPENDVKDREVRPWHPGTP